LEELESAGYLGLLQAHKNFDPERAVAFSSFAYYRIHGAMIDTCRRLGLMRRQYNKSHNQEAEEIEQTPLIIDGMKTRGVREVMGDGESGVRYLAIGMSEALIEATVLVGKQPLSPLKSSENQELSERLESGLEQLESREFHIIKQYYFAQEKLTEIADRLGVSKSWASRIHSRALEKLRPFLSGEAVESHTRY
jgi:RNA polymerase sigma factor for flagellar operon FliA